MFALVLMCMLALISVVAVWTRPKADSANPQGGPMDWGRFFASRRMLHHVVALGTALISVVILLSLSIVAPSGGQVGLVEKKWFCASSTSGTYLARDGQCGRQADILMPGVQFRWFFHAFNTVTYVDMVEVPDGHYAILKARDGLPQPDGQAAAPNWSQDEAQKMLGANYFLTEGNGIKGPQSAILKPAVYPLNLFLWDVNVHPGQTRTEIPTGYVGSVRSAVVDKKVPEFFKAKAGETTRNCTETREATAGVLKANLVNVGCLGVWAESLPSGSYFVNSNVYEVKPVDVRMQNSVYKGGYTRRSIDLTIDETTGNITQTPPHEEKVDLTKDVAGDAIQIKAEGWTIFQEIRIQWRIDPQNAPLVSAAVGGLKDVEDKIISPGIRSVARNIGGSSIHVKNTVAYDEALVEQQALLMDEKRLMDPALSDAELNMTRDQRASQLKDVRTKLANLVLPNPDVEIQRPTRVLDFQDNRAILEGLMAAQMAELGKANGVEIISVRLGNVDIPPELLVARKRQQLAGQQEAAFNQVRKAEVARQASERERARANKQSEIVQAQIDVSVAEQRQQQQMLLGRAQRAFDEEAAKGRKAQAEVLGQDRVVMLQGLEMVLKAVQANPDIVRVLPAHLSTLIIGSGHDGGLTNLGAMLKGIGGVPTVSPAK